MVCPDWSCGKMTCPLYNRITNSFSYTICNDCSAERKLQLCITCAYGLKITMQSNTYLCKKDNTIGFSIED